MKTLQTTIRTAGLALALGLAASAQGLQREYSMAEHFEAWKLAVTVGAPDAEAITELKGLIAQAEAALASSVQASDQRQAEEMLALVQAELARYEGQEPQQDGPGAASPEDGLLEREVQAALERGDHAFLAKLGRHATVPLMSLARRTTGIPAKEGAFSALSWLSRNEPAAALDVIVQLLESPNKLVREEAFRRAAIALGTDRETTWEPEGTLDWKLANPLWADLPNRAVQEESLDPRVCGNILEAFAIRGLLPRDLATNALELGNQGHLEPGWLPPGPETLWLYGYLFDNGSLGLRGKVIARLSGTPHLEACYGAALDDRLENQRDLASALLARKVNVYGDARTSQPTLTAYYPVASEELTATFKALVNSKFQAVSRQALGGALERVRSLGSLPFGRETLLELLASVDDPILLWDLVSLVKGLPEAERLPTLIAGIRRAGPRTEEVELSNRINSLLRQLGDLGVDASQGFWPIADAIVPFVDPTTERGRDSWTRYVNRAVTADGVDANGMLDWLERHGQGQTWAVDATYERNRPLAEWIVALSDADRYRLLVELAPSVLDAEGRAVSTLLSKGYLQDADLLQQMIRDPRTSDAGRVEATQYLLHEDGAQIPDDLLPAIAKSFSRYVSTPSTHFLSRMSADQRSQIFSLWLADQDVPDSFLLRIRFNIENEAMMGAVSQRFPRPTWSELRLPLNDQPNLLQSMVAFAVKQSTDTLHPLLTGNIHEASRVYEWLAFSIKGNRSAVLQPVAMAILADRPWGGAYSEAVQAVAGYFNSAAAEALLEAARVTSFPEQRTLATDALREITEWRETARAWSRAADSEVKRANAIAELVVKIKDPTLSVEMRAASIRGLGLLAAAEELPLIIDAMASDEREIQAAAKAAFARLEQEADR